MNLRSSKFTVDSALNGSSQHVRGRIVLPLLGERAGVRASVFTSDIAPDFSFTHLINTSLQRGGGCRKARETVSTVSHRSSKPLNRSLYACSKITPLKRGVNEISVAL